MKRIIHLMFNSSCPLKEGDQFRCHRFGDVHTVGPAKSGPHFVRVKHGWLYSVEGWNANVDELMRAHAEDISAYLSQDGVTVTSWLGRQLATVTLLKPAKHNRIVDDNYYTFRAVDTHGGHWHGRGSKGMAVTLKPSKGKL
jgi:hypothetical protein